MIKRGEEKNIYDKKEKTKKEKRREKA